MVAVFIAPLTDSSINIFMQIIVCNIIEPTRINATMGFPDARASLGYSSIKKINKTVRIMLRHR